MDIPYLICGNEVKRNINDASGFIRALTRKVFAGETQVYPNSMKEITDKNDELYSAIRRELNISEAVSGIEGD
jgi:hypothetical protein